MIIGYNFLSDEDSLTPSYINIGNIYKMIVSNAIYDEINIIDDGQYIFNINKSNWDYNNILLCVFQNNLNGGNVDFTDKTVSFLKIKRRKLEAFDWQDLHSFVYDKNAIDYEFYDKYVESGQEYEYTILPVTSDGTEGDLINIKNITSIFDGVFLINKDSMFRLIYNLEYNSTERVMQNEEYTPIGSKYPIIVSNGDIDYEKGSLKALVITEDSETGAIDRRQEKLLRKQLLNFLTSKKPMLLKDGNSNIYIISILGSPSIDYINELNQGLAHISFNWVEIGDSNDTQDLTNNGLL